MTQREQEARERAERKRALRRELRKRLPEPASAAAREAAAQVRETTLRLPEIEAARAILACLSFGREIDTWGLLERLLAEGHEVYVPRVDLRDRQLRVHRYPCELETLSFGLEQPRAGTPELPELAIDRTLGAVVIVGLGFDRRGYRLGSGRGYFDRFLAAHPLPAIGLAYDVQLVDRLPVEPHDVPMTLVVTETATLRPAEI